jgi:hypothetical protein
MVGVGERAAGGVKKMVPIPMQIFSLSRSLPAYGPYPTEFLSKQQSEKRMLVTEMCMQ